MNVLILSTFIFILVIFNPLASYSSHIDLPPCRESSHCALDNWDVKNIKEPLSDIQLIIEKLRNEHLKFLNLVGHFLGREIYTFKKVKMQKTSEAMSNLY